VVYLVPEPAKPFTAKDRATLEKISRERSSVDTFDGRVAETEEYMRRLRARSSSKHPRPFTRPWYAEQILGRIESIRWLLAHNQPQLAASDAVSLGSLIAEAHAKWTWPRRLLDRARRAKNRELSNRSKVVRAAATSERDLHVRELAREYRRNKPYARSGPGSTRAMALHISDSIDAKSSTVRGWLRRLKIR
jgi:hypothetical protein